MKTCRFCRSELIPDKLFCPECGQPVISEPSDTTPPPPVSSAPVPPKVYPTSQPPQAYPTAPTEPQQPFYHPPQAPLPMTNIVSNPSKHPKKHSVWMTVLIICLSVVMVTESVIAGVWYPGFFTGGGSATMEQLLNEAIQEENEQVDLMSYPVPGKPGEIVNSYTEEEFHQAPKTEIPVSPENPKAAAGKFAVDFGEWNLEQEDTLIVRELPEHYDSTTGYIINGYDFSLASGQSEFLTEVVLTVPRDPEDDYNCMFVTKNKETGKYEYSYFEVSDDGANYLIYTTHFSEQDMITYKGFAEYVVKDLEDGSIDSAATLDSLCAFYYPNYVSPTKRMTAPVRCNYNYLWNAIASRYTRKPPGIDVLPYLAEQIRNTPKDKLQYTTPLSKLLYTNEGADILNNANTLREGVGNKLSLQSISPQIKNAAEAASKSGRLSFSSGLGAAATLIGYYFTLDKMAYEAKQGKYPNLTECYKQNWLGYVGLAVGVVGLVAIPGGAVALTAAAAGLGVYTYSYASSRNAPRDLSTVEQIYRDYYFSPGGRSIRIFYDEPSLTDSFDSNCGNMKPLKSLDEKQNKKLKEYLNKNMAALRVGTGIPGDDPRKVRIQDRAWVAVLSGLFRLLKDTPEKYGEAFQEFYHNYAEACWNMSDSAYLSFARKAMEARGWDPNSAALLSVSEPEKAEQIKQDYINNFAAELAAKHSPIILANIIAHIHLAQLEAQEVIENQLLPRLNTMVEFRVVDKSLSDPNDFSQSVYHAPLRRKEAISADTNTYYGRPDFSKCVESTMYFTIKDTSGKLRYVNKPIFLPRLRNGTRTRVVSYEDYYPAHPNFLPHLSGDTGNVVFRCTYFHYLMMGSPTAISFHDVSGNGKNDKVVDFVFPEPDQDGIIRVTVEAPPLKQANALEMKITSDNTMHYSVMEEIEESVQNPLPANNTVALGDDGKSITFTLPAVSHSFHSISDTDNYHIDYEYSYTRSAIELTGKITETRYHSDGTVASKVGVILTAPDTITGTGLDKSNRHRHGEDGNIQIYFQSSVNLSQLVLGQTETEGNLPDDVSRFYLNYDDQEQIKTITLKLYGTSKRTLSTHDDPKGYTTTDTNREITLERVD